MSTFLRAVLPWVLTALVCAPIKANDDFSPEGFLNDVKFLASPKLKGRRTGTEGANEAAKYIGRTFRAIGLKPLSGNYLQPFDVTVRSGVRSAKLAVAEDVVPAGEALVPLNLSQSGSVKGKLVFAGYGISAPEYKYDDYAGIDARGKIVMMLLHEPQENSEGSKFAGREYTSHAEISSKLANAKLHGAIGALLVRDLPNHKGEKDALGKFQPIVSAQNFGIVAVGLSAKSADTLLRNANKDLSTLCSEIDKNPAPHSFEWPGEKTAELQVSLREEKHTVDNVIGYLPGETNEYEVIGAHYDHLGLGEQDSLAPSQVGTVHPGADDNASGVAGVMALARHFSGEPRHRRGILFASFSGEEEGLLGSEFMASHMPLPSADAVAMINLDMIGRLREKRLYVGGTATGSNFAELVDAAARHAGLTSDLSEAGGYGASDHTSFTTKRIPTLFFFTGLHSDYHKPSDTWDKINAEGAVQMLREVAEIAASIADTPERPQFRSAPPAHPSAAPGNSGGGYGPYFGSVPDFGQNEGGVKFADVREGSPAAKAGLKPGDIMVEFGGKKVQNLYDFTYLLREHKPSDVVHVKALRGSQLIEVDVTLTERR